LGTSLISYVIPLIKINSATEVIPQEFVIALPEVILYPSTVIEKSATEPAQVFDILGIVYWVGITIAAMLFFVKLFKLKTVIQKSTKQKINQYFLVLLNSNNAFSFFNYIFLGNAISEENKQQIIEHELVHVQQKHSVDLLFFELQKIICWFNPMSYIFQRRITEVHEFIADAHSIKETDKTTYFNKLLAETFGVQHISFINPFFKHSLIKKRIIMLHKNRSKQLLKFKYLLLVPLLGGMLLYAACERELEKNDSAINKNEKRLEKLYLKSPNDEEIKVIESKKEGYFDLYLGFEPDGKEITYDDLTNNEREEYDKLYNGFNREGESFHTYKIYEDQDGKRSLLQIIDWKGLLAKDNKRDYNDAGDVPFAAIDKVPLFSDCESSDDPKKCFAESVSKHVSQKFNTSLASELGLGPGKKKVYVQFTIDKEGNITNIKARGPHQTLEGEAVRVINMLPKMIPGEHNGKKVSVKYTLPITLTVD
jgi:beta-lactamase regulating signal transducer with metallopeptidase domain